MIQESLNMKRKWIFALPCVLVAFGIFLCISSRKTETVIVEAEAETKEEFHSENRLEQILHDKQIVVATSPDYAPYEFVYKTKGGAEVLEGADMKLASYIAQQLGVELVVREGDFEQCLSAVQTGAADLVLAGLLPDKERKKVMDFTDAYYNAGEQCIVIEKKEETKVSAAERFAGEKIAAQYGSLQAQLVAEQLYDSYMETTKTAVEGLSLLKSGRVDGVALSKTVAEKFLSENQGYALSSVKLQYEPASLVAGIPENEPELKKKINEIIKEVTLSGAYFEWLDEACAKAAEIK